MFLQRMLILVCLFFLILTNSLAQNDISAFKPKMSKLIHSSSKLRPTTTGISKPIIDSTAIKHWVTLEDSKVAISNDGKYFIYNILNQPYRSNTLVVKAIESDWKKELVGVDRGVFTSDSKQFAYIESNTLYFLQLGSNERHSISNVSNFKLVKEGQQQWLFYQLKSSDRKLVLRKIATGKEQEFENVAEYKYDEPSGNLLLKKESEQNGVNLSALQWINLQNGTITNIWSPTNGLQLISYSVDWSNRQLTMLVSDTFNNLSSHSIWYYKQGMNEPIRVVSNQTPGIDAGLTLAACSDPKFNKSGKYLCFLLKEIDLPKPNLNGPLVDVWSYHDTTLQSTQLMKIERGEQDLYQAVVMIENISTSEGNKVIRLMQEGDEPAITGVEGIAGDYFLARQTQGGELFWERKIIYKLVSMKDGTFKAVHESKNEVQFWFSPTGRYLVHFQNDHHYYCYNLVTGTKKNISEIVNANFNLENPRYKGYNFTLATGVAGWIEEDSGVLVYDNNDIWLLDLENKKPPVNLTDSFGRLHNLKIRLVNQGRIFNKKDTILLSVFNPTDKSNGLYRVALSNQKAIDKPITGPWKIYFNREGNQGAVGIIREFFSPLKANDANEWIVKKESVSEAPNYYITEDFKVYKPLTNLQPQKNYNWLTAELRHWTLSDGTVGQGILYKPQNFDPYKKYPVIFYYYEGMTGRLHEFPVPEFCNSTHIQIAWFVSHGYLVFTPDMYYINGKVPQSVCNTLVTAAKSLSRLAYVDHKKMGISGFSWGGGQTNWLITGTNVFAAAATGGASADPISHALQITGSRGSKEDNAMEYQESLLGTSLWTDRERWISTAPMLRANNVTMPVLIMNNYGDKVWQQGTELYMALRRLNKKVWMLQYDRGDHGVYDFADAEDFTIRYTQFFDHFLKGAPIPKWMSEGIPAKLKGIELGYEFDSKNTKALRNAQ